MPNVDAEFIISNNRPKINTIFEINANPTRVSQLENDLNYQTREQVSESIAAALEPIEEEIAQKVETIDGSPLIDASRNDNTVTISSKTFVFEQGVSSDTWEIEHNLNKFPSVTLVDTAGTQFQGRVEYIDANNCVVYMNGATKGKAYLN